MAFDYGKWFNDALWKEFNRTYKSPTEKFFDQYSEEVEFEAVSDTPDMDQRSDDIESESHSDNYRNPISEPVSEPECKEEEWVPLKTMYKKILINSKS